VGQGGSIPKIIKEDKGKQDHHTVCGRKAAIGQGREEGGRTGKPERATSAGKKDLGGG